MTGGVINNSSFSMSPLCKCINCSRSYLFSRYNYLIVTVKGGMKALAVLFCEIRKQMFSLKKILHKHIAYTPVLIRKLPMSVHLTESENVFQANKMSVSCKS